MPRTAVQIGPTDHGRRMSLDDFDAAEGREGHVYELSRAIVTVTDVPDFRHLRQVDAIRRQFYAFWEKHPDRIHAMGSGSDCKVLISGLESERHPDWSVYKQPPPDEQDVWRTWVPEIVIEVVSRSSRQRDYEEKPEEYLAFGVREYWIVDEQQQEMLVHRRFGGRWRTRVVTSTESYSARVLAGFRLDVGAGFAAARTGRD